MEAVVELPGGDQAALSLVAPGGCFGWRIRKLQSSLFKMLFPILRQGETSYILEPIQA